MSCSRTQYSAFHEFRIDNPFTPSHCATQLLVYWFNRFKPSSKIILLTVLIQGGTSFADHLGYLCLVFVMLLRLFITALWSPAGKGLTSWLLLVIFNCVFVLFPCDILGQVWYLIVLIPDLFSLSYFNTLCYITPTCKDI